MKTLGLIAVLLTGGLLLTAVQDFPRWGDAESPANAGVISEHYLEKSLEQTAVPNVVTAVLADYRGFDTLFDTVVVLTAGLAILGILGGGRGETRESPRPQVTDQDLIVVMTCRLVVPVIQLFALYVVAHGHHSPGGGFQGGVIFGASAILLAITRDLPAALRYWPERRAFWMAGIGVLIFAGTGVLALVLGGEFLNYARLDALYPGADPVMARSHSMLVVEIGVAFTVASVMYSIYAYLTSGGRLQGGL